MLKILIVEDEILIADQIANHLRALGYVVAGMARTFDEAVKCIQSEKPQLALLDIRIKGEKSGLDLGKWMKDHCDTGFIYLTSYFDAQTVLKAKETQPLGYVTKPFDRQDLFIAIEIATSRPSLNADEKEIVLKSGKSNILIQVNEILYVEADRSYVHVVTTRKIYTLRKSLKDLLAALQLPRMVRTHRSFAVNVNHIVQYDASSVRLPVGEIPMSEDYRESVQAALAAYR